MVQNTQWVDYPRLLSIDPGGATIGFAVCEWDMRQGRLRPLHVFTHHVDKSLRHEYRHLEDLYDPLDLRMRCIHDVVSRLCRDWGIWQVAHETPFMGSFAQAYASLTAVCTQIRQAAMTHYPPLPVFGYSPSEVKKAVGVMGRSDDKGLMSKAICKSPHLDFSRVQDEVDTWDEHGVDAVAVAVAHYKTFWEDFPCDT